MKIKKVEIEGFRAYKYKEDGLFDFTNEGEIPANFVAIYAPNGFGKSSFYDAVEWAITNHLERFGGDYNRSNHELAAKSTKEKGVPQKILRNRDVASNIPTRVKVITTLPKPFNRKLKTTRSDSSDIRISANKSKENEYFRKVILSQDEIDRFLKEAKPQDRYKRFMDSFGCDAEVSRQELTALIYDNRVMLSELEKDKVGLLEQLHEPVDISMFEQFNKIISELNADGETLALVDESFSINTQHDMFSTFITRSHDLKEQATAKTVLRESLAEHFSKLPELQLNLDQSTEQKKNLAKFSKGLQEAQRYQALLASHSKLQNEHLSTSQQLVTLKELAEYSRVFLDTEKEIITETEKCSTLSRQHLHEAALLADIQQSLSKVDTDLVAADERSFFLRTTINNCPSIYSDIMLQEEKLTKLGTQIVETDSLLNLKKNLRDGVQSGLTTISGLTITAQSLLTSDLSAINFDGIKLKELGSISEELNGWIQHDQSVQKTQISLAEQMGLHERLVATGLEYLSVWPTNICPLCQSPHDSESALKKKVENTDLLSSLSKENAEKLKVSTKRQSVLKAKMDTIVQEALDIQMGCLAGLRERLNELGLQVSNLEQQKSLLHVETHSLQSQIKSQQLLVWGLAKEELISRAEAEINELAGKINELLVNKADLSKKIDAKKVLIDQLDSSLKILNLQIQEKSAGAIFQKVNVYLKEHGLLSNELKAHCDEKRAVLEKSREKCLSDATAITEQSKSLQESMIANDTWLDVDTLSTQKVQAESYIAKSESFIQSFIVSLNRMIGPLDGKSIDEVRGAISEAINLLLQQYQKIDSKLKKFGLLSELLKASESYLTSLSLRENLTVTEQHLAQRALVDETLQAERERVIDELRKLIKSFFYEDLIDSIYRKIDPHPSLKKVEFRPDFETSDRPGLNIVLSDGKGNSVSPILYFSAAQLNILSLSVFLASALHAKDDSGNSIDVIMIDDPIQSMDSINVLATIDLLRSISVRFNKQIIISTHDENFFGLLQRKIPAEVLGSKFLKLEKFGVVVPVESLANE
ncbi:AAA family ATPase [Rahnella perminowiae]|uniref:AAA family ATPase n=1 Tax=Rahnella perminowiae TaxID=2816244 RepID=UPI001EE5D11F|nr:AAA family ATPase [Rahnella perminowiae]